MDSDWTESSHFQSINRNTFLSKSQFVSPKASEIYGWIQIEYDRGLEIAHKVLEGGLSHVTCEVGMILNSHGKSVPSGDGLVLDAKLSIVIGRGNWWNWNVGCEILSAFSSNQ